MSMSARAEGEDGEIPAGLDGLSSLEARRRLSQLGPHRWVKRDPLAAPVLGVDVLLEARSQAALKKLARAAAPFAHVVRDGHIVSVPLEDVVPGDVLVLPEGHVVAADGVVRWEANLAIDESPLTGEAEPQSKRTWRADAGEASRDARFFAGSQALLGHGFGFVTATGPATQYGGIAALVAADGASVSPLQRQAGALVRRLGVVALVVAAAVFALSVARGADWMEGLLGAISLAMAAIPEEFPVVLTLFLSVGAWRLAERGMLVRRLASVETLGSTTMICTDKTGTLTHGEFQMTRHVVLAPDLPERDLLEAAVLACERHPTDAMERAILVCADARGVAAQSVWASRELVRDYDFDAIGKHMSHVWRALDTGAYIVAAKGAVEGILAHTGLSDAGRAGIRIAMVTGDHGLTAHAVAEAAGILHQDDLIVTGDELAALNHTDQVLVFAERIALPGLTVEPVPRTRPARSPLARWPSAGAW